MRKLKDKSTAELDGILFFLVKDYAGGLKNFRQNGKKLR